MYQKFIITDDGVMRFGDVYLHRDLLEPGEDVSNGGGLWLLDEPSRSIILYGRSFEYGGPDFTALRKIDWNGVGGRIWPLFYYPHWPSRDTAERVFAHP